MTDDTTKKTTTEGSDNSPKKKKSKPRKKSSAAKETSSTLKQSTSDTKATKKAPAKKTHKITTKEAEHTHKQPKTKEEQTETTKEKMATKTEQETIEQEASLSGIDDLSAYIARTKSATEKKQTTPDTLTTSDGTNLTTLPGLYAVVPHAKGDHKLVFLRDQAPEGLLDDPKNRTIGEMYIKNNHPIYKVNLTMKEHPTLKDSHGKPLDVWIIDSPDQLTEQISSIKSGMGGGENFGSPVTIDQKAATAEPTKEITVLPQEEDKHSEPRQEESLPDNMPETADLSTDTPDDLDIDTTLPDDIILPPLVEEDTVNLPLGETEIEKAQETFNDNSSPEEPASGFELPTDSTPDLSNTTTTETPFIEHNEEQSINEPVSDTAPLPEEAPSFSFPTDEEATVPPLGETESSVSLDGFDIPDTQTPDSLPTFTSPENNKEESSMFSNTGSTETEEAFSLDMDENDHMHFGSPDPTISSTEPSPSSSEEENSSSMFHTPEPLEGATLPVQLDIEDTTPQVDSPLFAQSTSHTEEQTGSFSSTTDSTPSYEVSPMETESNYEVTPMQTEESDEVAPMQTTPEETVSNYEVAPMSNTSEGLDLDSLHIDDTQTGGIDLDSLTTSTSTTHHEEDIETVAAKKKKFPIGIIIRLIVFLVIVGALILIWKVMFPAIKGNSSPNDNDNTPPSDTQDITIPTTGNDDNTLPPEDDTTIPLTGATDPVPTTGVDEQPDDTTDPVDNTTPPLNNNGQLTITELQAKLEDQQTEARKILNIAKLLENKSAIKFSLAAMLKAGNTLERIASEPSITSTDIEGEVKKIDFYLAEASKLVE